MSFLNNVLIAVFFTFPQAIVIISLGLQLITIKVPMKKLVIICFINTLLYLLLLIINSPLGINTILQTVIIFFVITFVAKLKLYKSIIVFLLGFLIDSIIQFLVFTIGDVLIGFDYQRLATDFSYKIPFFVTVVVIELVILYILKKKNIHLFNLGDSVDK